MAKYGKSSTSGSIAHVGERSGSGAMAGTKEVGGMNPGKVSKSFAAKRYVEGGQAGGKGMKTSPKNQEGG